MNHVDWYGLCWDYPKYNMDQYCEDRLKQSEGLGAYQIYLLQRGQCCLRNRLYSKISNLPGTQRRQCDGDSASGLTIDKILGVRTGAQSWFNWQCIPCAVIAFILASQDTLSPSPQQAIAKSSKLFCSSIFLQYISSFPFLLSPFCYRCYYSYLESSNNNNNKKQKTFFCQSLLTLIFLLSMYLTQ